MAGEFSRRRRLEGNLVTHAGARAGRTQCKIFRTSVGRLYSFGVTGSGGGTTPIFSPLGIWPARGAFVFVVSELLGGAAPYPHMMKLNSFLPLPNSLVRLGAVAAIMLGAAQSARAVVISFSGGSGAPLSMTIASPVSYTITGTGGGTPPPYFVFQGVGNVFGGFPAISGSITFSVNGGAGQTIDTANSGFGFGAITPADMYFFGTRPGFAIGDTVVLSAGTLTTTSNFAGAAPASGNFQTFIISGNATNISTLGATNGANAPDAGSTAALLGLGLLGMFSFARMFRRAE